MWKPRDQCLFKYRDREDPPGRGLELLALVSAEVNLSNNGGGDPCLYTERAHQGRTGARPCLRRVAFHQD